MQMWRELNAVTSEGARYKVRWSLSVTAFPFHTFSVPSHPPKGTVVMSAPPWAEILHLTVPAWAGDLPSLSVG